MTKPEVPPEYRPVLIKALQEYGRSAQMAKALEEVGELEEALNLYDDLDTNFPESAVVTEIADVIIICHQLAILFGIEEVNEEIEYKMSRLNDRIEEER